MKEKYKLRHRLKYEATRCSILKYRETGEIIYTKGNSSWRGETRSKLRRKDKQVINIKPTIYFEVHFSETKNKGEYQGKKGYFYKLHTMLQFSEINPVKFHYYNSEKQLRRALEDFGEIEKITRVTNMNPLAF